MENFDTGLRSRIQRSPPPNKLKLLMENFDFGFVESLVLGVWRPRCIPERYHLIHIITARKRSLRRLCFYRRLSVHGGGGVRGCSRGACVVAPGGHAWLLLGGACVVAPGGGMRGFSDEIRSMSGRYASYWNAFLLFLLLPLRSSFNCIVPKSVIKTPNCPVGKKKPWRNVCGCKLLG